MLLSFYIFNIVFSSNCIEIVKVIPNCKYNQIKLLAYSVHTNPIECNF